jgi:Tol biopolymer transport system component
MTTFERFERDIPKLMTDLAPARVPDYFDSMLQETARHRQRPAWSYFERWIPMGVLARTAPVRPFPWRTIIALALLVLLIAAALFAYSGSMQQRLPAPFGPARNGQIVFSTADGDISAVDPKTGTVRPLIIGETEDIAPWFSPNGQHFMFVRKISGGDAYFVADADGSNIRKLVDPRADWFEWSPASDRIVVRHWVDGVITTSIVDVASGASTKLDVGLDVQVPTWRPDHDQIVFSTDEAENHFLYVVNPNGKGLRRLATAPGAVNSPSLAPDGRSIAYATWEADKPGRQGRIHILDIDAGVDHEPALPASSGAPELDPIFSPDGTKLLLERYVPAGGYRLVIVPVDGNGPAITLGDLHPEFTNGASAMWSPDGKTILATYNNDHRTWLFSADGNSAQRVDWTTTDSLTWQRLAP